MFPLPVVVLPLAPPAATLVYVQSSSAAKLSVTMQGHERAADSLQSDGQAIQINGLRPAGFHAFLD